MRWRIYYGDGSTYSDQDGPPELAPGRNLQVIVQLDPDHGRFLICGGREGRREDYFWWDDDTQSWFCGDYPGLIDMLMESGWKKVIFGRSIGDEAFHRIKKTALADSDFPPKTGWRRGEKF